MCVFSEQSILFENDDEAKNKQLVTTHTQVVSCGHTCTHMRMDAERRKQ